MTRKEEKKALVKRTGKAARMKSAVAPFHRAEVKHERKLMNTVIDHFKKYSLWEKN